MQWRIWGAEGLHFHAVCGENWSNDRLAHPLQGWYPPVGNFEFAIDMRKT